MSVVLPLPGFSRDQQTRVSDGVVHQGRGQGHSSRWRSDWLSQSREDTAAVYWEDAVHYLGDAAEGRAGHAGLWLRVLPAWTLSGGHDLPIHVSVKSRSKSLCVLNSLLIHVIVVFFVQILSDFGYDDSYFKKDELFFTEVTTNRSFIGDTKKSWFQVVYQTASRAFVQKYLQCTVYKEMAETMMEQPNFYWFLYSVQEHGWRYEEAPPGRCSDQLRLAAVSVWQYHGDHDLPTGTYWLYMILAATGYHRIAQSF